MSSAQKATAGSQEATSYQWLRKYPKDVDWFQQFRPVPMGQLLDTAVAAHGSRMCTNFLGKRLTYAEIGQLVERTAAGLQELGVKRGTRVGLLMPNCPTFIIYYFATLKAGGTIVNYNPLYTPDELAFQVKDSETELMVTLDLKLLFDKVEGLMEAGVSAGHRRVLLCSPAIGKVRPVQAVQGQGACPPRQVADGRKHRFGRRRARECRYLPEARDQFAERCRRTAVHRRHDGHAQGGHADPRQYLGELSQGAAWATRISRAARSGRWRPSRSFTYLP